MFIKTNTVIDIFQKVNMKTSITWKILKLFEKIGFFSKVGVVMYPIISLALLSSVSTYNYFKDQINYSQKVITSGT